VRVGHYHGSQGIETEGHRSIGDSFLISRRYCIETAAYSFPSTYVTLCFREIGVSPKQGYFPQELCPKLRDLENFATAPTVGECDINSNIGWSGVDSTWRQRADGRRACVQR